MNFPNSQLVQTSAAGKALSGVTYLGDEMFIVHDEEAAVQVYDVDALSLKRSLPVTGLTEAWDLTSCVQNNSLYCCNFNGDCVFQIDVKGNATRWSPHGSVYSLSVTANSNVLVTIEHTSKLNMFTANGCLLREINLQQSAPGPLHSVQLSDGQFLVSHGGKNRACVIDDDGKLVQCYSGPIGFGVGQIQTLYHLIVDNQGFIAAADYFNNKVVLLSPSLTYVKELISADKGVPQNPFRMYFDKRRGQLCVAGHGCGSLSVFRGEPEV